MDPLNLPHLMWEELLDPRRTSFGDWQEEDFSQAKQALKTKIAEHLEKRGQ